MAVESQSDPKYAWTVMVYLAGDNNLSGEMIYAIKEMKRVKDIGPDKKVVVLALFDPPQGLPAQAYVIWPGDEDNKLINEAELAASVISKNDNGTLTSTLTIKPPKNSTTAPINTGDPITLLQFINYGIKNYEAKHYMVILSGHGSGADQDFFLKDDSASDSLTIHELKQVFRKVKEQQPSRSIDILGLDSCLMSMAEVYYELASVKKPIEPQPSTTAQNSPKSNNLVDFIVGAEGFELNTGWPYERVLSALTVLANNPQTTPQNVAEMIVGTYILYYSDYALSGASVDLAACELRYDLRKELKQSIAKLATELKNNLSDEKVKDAVLLAHWYAQSYKFDQYTDIVDFCNELGKRCGNGNIVAACGEVIAAIGRGDKIVKKSCYSGPAVQYSYGLSIYFPWNRVSPFYQQLQFAKDTRWHEFLAEYVEATRRDPRIHPCQTEPNTVKNGVLNPLPEGGSPGAPTPLGIKFAKPDFRFAKPDFRFAKPDFRDLGNVPGSAKNPAVKWCPCNCPNGYEELLAAHHKPSAKE